MLILSEKQMEKIVRKIQIYNQGLILNIGSNIYDLDLFFVLKVYLFKSFFNDIDIYI